jgi:hypothetical protein
LEKLKTYDVPTDWKKQVAGYKYDNHLEKLKTYGVPPDWKKQVAGYKFNACQIHICSSRLTRNEKLIF